MGKTEICCSDECSGRLTCNIGQAFLHEGHLRLVIDIRYPVTKKTEDFLPKLKTEAAKSGINIIGIEDSRPYYMNPEQPFIQILMEAWREVSRFLKADHLLWEEELMRGKFPMQWHLALDRSEI